MITITASHLTRLRSGFLGVQAPGQMQMSHSQKIYAEGWLPVFAPYQLYAVAPWSSKSSTISRDMPEVSAGWNTARLARDCQVNQ